MHTVELLEQSVNLAKRLGYRIRHEWLGGQGGGLCEFGGNRWIFVDLGQSTTEQLHQVANVLRDDPSIYIVKVPPDLQRYLVEDR